MSLPLNTTWNKFSNFCKCKIGDVQVSNGPTLGQRTCCCTWRLRRRCTLVVFSYLRLRRCCGWLTYLSPDWRTCHLTVIPDLTVVCHLTVVPDLTVVCHLTVIPDLTVVGHLTVVPDLTIVCHLTVVPDLTVVCHLTVVPDLTVVGHLQPAQWTVSLGGGGQLPLIPLRRLSHILCLWRWE